MDTPPLHGGYTHSMVNTPHWMMETPHSMVDTPHWMAETPHKWGILHTIIILVTMVTYTKQKKHQ